MLYCYELYYCDCLDKYFKFCSICWTSVSQGELPKIGIFNKMPQIYYQDYSGPLDGLISIEETVITRANLVIIILKLRPNNRFNPKLYMGV